VIRVLRMSCLALMFLMFLLFLAGVSANAQQSGNISPVGIPLFHFKDGSSHWSGKAFAVQWFGQRKLLLCPFHCLSFHKDLDPKIVPDIITSVDVLDLQGREVMTTATRGLLRTGISVAKRTGSLTGDMTAFELPADTKLPPYVLSGQLPVVGTRAWVLSKEQDSTSLEPDRYPGTVTFSNNVGLDITLDHPLTAPASSGAPVVDAKNQLIGMMVGTDGVKRSVAKVIPTAMLYKRLFLELGR
jgi:hypothetical protein